MPGGNPRFLRINLSTGEIKAEPVKEQVTMDFIGGRGYGIHYLYRELAPKVDPYGEENKIFFLNGVLAGTAAQAVSRWVVYTKSPLTNGFARSVAGADFGAWMKFAGYDFLVVEGKSEKPIYIHLTPDDCQIRDAGELWGKDTVVTQEWLAEQHGKDTRIACIGPAGERLVRYAAIVSARRTAGRCGTGAVMGSKNLKALAITAKRNLQIHDSEGLKALTKKQAELIRDSKAFQHHKEMGTTDTQRFTSDLGIYPTKNFRYGRLTDYEKILGSEYRKLRIGEFGCYSCAAKCGKIHRVDDGPYAGAMSEGPEYETIWSFNGPIENSYIEASIAADQICDDLGIDTISTGNCIGFAYELYEKGLLTKGDTDGLELTYGNHAAMMELVKKIAMREGIGELLAEGTMRMAEKIGQGSDKYAMHVKGLEMPAYEPRGAKSQGYNYVTSNIGASHCYGFARQEIFGAPDPREVDRFAEEENADIVVLNQNASAMREVGIVCNFAAGWGWIPGLYGKMLATATGIEQFKDFGYLKVVGERIINLERAFIAREGFTRKDDTFPERITSEPLLTRGAPGEGQMVRDLDTFLDRYYQIRGWTKEGVPTKEKIKELGLDSIL